MSQGLLNDPAVALVTVPPHVERSARRPLRLIENGHYDRPRLPTALEAAVPPAIEPGQLWFIEAPANQTDPAPFEHRALIKANVVIYDRALTAFVAAILPLGSYAEPAASSDGERALDRSLRFARDGWSVVRLVEGNSSSSQRIGQIRRLSERLIAANVPIGLPASLFMSAGNGICERTEAHLGIVVDACDIEKRLTIVFAPLSIGAPRLHTALSNGLAG